MIHEKQNKVGGSTEFSGGVWWIPHVIVTHRDPVKCIPSITQTLIATRKIYSDDDSTSMLGPGLLGAFAGAANAHMQWRDNHPEVEILDLSFREITEDGVATVHKIYDFLGMPFTEQAKQGVLRWERDNPKDKHGKTNYSAASMGTTEQQIADAFAEYRRRFAAFI